MMGFDQYRIPRLKWTATMVAVAALIPVAAQAQTGCDRANTNHANRIVQCDALIAAGDMGNVDYSDALFYRGYSLSQTGNKPAAIANYSAAIAVHPTANAYDNRGWVRYELGQNEAAFTDVSRAVELNPQSQNAWSNRAAIALRMGRFDEAMISADRLLALDPAHKTANAYRARAYLGQGRFAQAMTAIEQAIRTDSSAAYMLIDRGMIHQAQGDDLRAFGDYDAALRSTPNDAWGLYGRGLAQMRLGRTTDGRADIARATTIMPDIAEHFARYGIRP
jgi:tetratricopeptide (TPR) repeat protein